MEFIPYRMLRNEPGQLSDKLAEEGQIVITRGGEPFAVMLRVKSGELEEVLTLLSRLRAQQAVSALRAAARARGLDRLEADEIDTEVQAVRSARGAR